MARWIMFHLRNRFPCGIVITGTKMNKFWQQYVPPAFIHEVDDLAIILEQVYKRQAFLKKHGDSLGIDSRFFIIFDDVLREKYKVRFSKELSRAFTDGRHYNIFTLICCQDPRGIPPDLRENSDMAIIFRQFNKTRKDAVTIDFVDYLDDKTMQREFLWKHTGKINKDGTPFDPKAFAELNDLKEKNNKQGIPKALVCIQADTTENLFDIFKTAVAEDPGPFRLGDPRYWKGMEEGRMRQLMNTFDGFVAKKPKRRKLQKGKKRGRHATTSKK